MRNFLRLSVIAAATIVALPVAQALAAPTVPAEPLQVKMVQTNSADLPAAGATEVQYYHHHHRRHWHAPRYRQHFYRPPHHHYRPHWGHHQHRGHGYGHRHHRHHW